ncbi:MAG: hypothetical protein ACYTEL_00090 [Planctomycetota bacterium]|jgi:hypothetical protein
MVAISSSEDSWSSHYDQIASTRQRAYIINKGSEGGVELEFLLDASDSSPIVNPVFVVKKWGPAGATVLGNGRRVKLGKKYRLGCRYTLEGSDLIVWLNIVSAKPVRISLSPAAN